MMSDSPTKTGGRYAWVLWPIAFAVLLLASLLQYVAVEAQNPDVYLMTCVLVAAGVAHITPGSDGIAPELLTTKQAAELLSIGERTLWAWSRSGICPAPVKIGVGLRPAVRYRRTELEQWVADGCPRVDANEKGGGPQ